MASITLEDVPETFIQKYGTTIRFSAFTVTPRKQSFRERMEDPSNTSYGPFTPEEFLAVQKSWR